MQQAISEHLTVFKVHMLCLFLVLAAGISAGFIAASFVTLVVLFFVNPNIKLEVWFVLFLFTFFLGDNFDGALGFANNLRFIILALGLLLLWNENLFADNAAKHILPFALFATLITYLLSPLGVLATIRGVSYYLMALVVFKLSTVLIEKDSSRFYNLIVLSISLFVVLNCTVFVFPVLKITYLKGRFMGLMNNPNGLAMVAMFAYPIIDLLRRKDFTIFTSLALRIVQILLIILVILAGSRTSLLCIVAYEAIIRLYQRKIILFFAILTLLATFTIIINIDIERVLYDYGLSGYFRVETLKTGSGRTDVWKVAIEEIQEQPWLGKGMLYDDYFVKDYSRRYLGENAGRKWGGIWSSYLSLLLNVGAVGFLIFSYFWYKMMTLSKMPTTKVGFLILCLLSAVTESWMAASMNAFMPLILLFWAIQIYQPEEEIKEL